MRSNYTCICCSASCRLEAGLGAWAVSQHSSKRAQGSSADLHPQCMSREACYEARYFTCGVSTVRHGVFFLKLAKTAQNLADHFKVTLKLLVSKKGQLLCLSPVTCIPPTAHCLPPSPHQPQPHSSGTPCAGPDPASPPSPRQLIRYMGWGFLLIQHTKSCSNVAGAQTQKVLNRCLNLLQTPCMGLGRTVESCVSQLAWL